MSNLWSSTSTATWMRALDSYEQVVLRQEVQRLPELDRWYRHALPEQLRSRQPPFVSLDELIRVTEWKMARGVWRAANLARVRRLSPADAAACAQRALAAIPDARQPIAELARLDGVGPATASAVLAAAAPEHYPFFDELVADQVPALGAVKWTTGYYVAYAAALRERAGALGAPWTPAAVAHALWAHSGGKASLAP